MAEIPCLLLAAGASSRMGRDKQLLPWGELTLIEHQVQTLLNTGNQVVVVLGHNAKEIQAVLHTYPVEICINKHWENGIGNSIARGINFLERKFPNAAGALICQVDQALITSTHFNKMFRTFRPGSRQILVSSSPSGWQGVPVLFDSRYFAELQNLSSDEGARNVFRDHAEAVQILETGDILDDMDTPESYHKLLETYIRQSAAK